MISTEFLKRLLKCPNCKSDRLFFNQYDYKWNHEAKCLKCGKEYEFESDGVYRLKIKGERNKVPDTVIQKVEGLKTVSIPFLGELGKKGKECRSTEQE